MVEVTQGIIVGRSSLSWRKTGDLHDLHFGRRAPLLHIEPDATWPGMFRIGMPDGSRTDMVNLTRAKDAGMSLGLALLRRTSPEPVTAPAKGSTRWQVPAGAGRSRLVPEGSRIMVGLTRFLVDGL